MVDELHRVLKTNGSLFIRMASIFGIEDKIIKNGHQYYLPDGSSRFLLTQDHVLYFKSKFDFIEPLKTVNVNNLRCMSTLVLRKL